MNVYPDSPTAYVVLCIKTVPVLFLLDLARVCVLFCPVLFEINRAIMRDWRGGRVSSKKNGERERDKRTRGGENSGFRTDVRFATELMSFAGTPLGSPRCSRIGVRTGTEHMLHRGRLPTSYRGGRRATTAAASDNASASTYVDGPASCTILSPR